MPTDLNIPRSVLTAALDVSDTFPLIVQSLTVAKVIHSHLSVYPIVSSKVRLQALVIISCHRSEMSGVTQLQLSMNCIVGLVANGIVPTCHGHCFFVPLCEFVK